MRYCEKCGLPETYPDIEFNDHGSCNYCDFYDEHKEILHDPEKRHQIFIEKVELAKKKAAVLYFIISLDRVSEA